MENLGREKVPSEFSLSELTYTVDSFSNGLAIGQHRLPPADDPRDHYNLRIIEDSEMIRLRSRYALCKENPLVELERHLIRISRQGILRAASIYLGTTTDPFFPFEGKFDASIKFLDLFMRYTPGLLVVQTRSPLIVIAMPVFRKLGKHAAVTIGLETHLEESVQRYTPGLPRVEERLKTIRALRNFGIEVTVQVSPVLPYGDWKSNAFEFAELLSKHADYIYVKPLSDGTDRSERKVRTTTIAKKLADDRKYQWLRPDSAKPLITALENICPKKLMTPDRKHLFRKQMKMFAA